MKLFKIFLVLFLALIISFSGRPALAAGIQNTNAGVNNNNGGGINNTQPPSAVSLTNPLSVNTPQALIGLVINAILGIIGSIALIMFIFGGFTWLTSAGNTQKVQQGQQILLWAAIGLVVIFLSYALVRFVITSVGA